MTDKLYLENVTLTKYADGAVVISIQNKAGAMLLPVDVKELIAWLTGEVRKKDGQPETDTDAGRAAWDSL